MTRFTAAAADGPKRFGLGRHGEMTADEARQKVAVAIDRIRQGLDPDSPPEAPEPTVTDLAERYMESHVRMNCRPNTIKCFGLLVRLYIIPELGHLRLSEVDRSHVSTLHHQLRDKPAQANYVLDVLSGMLRLAEAWGMTPHRTGIRANRFGATVHGPWSGFSRPTSTGNWGVCWTRGGSRRLGNSDGYSSDPYPAADGLPQERDSHPQMGLDDVDRLSGISAIPTRRLPPSDDG